jgi:uncharacterized ferritin-like protein (DUF455 family)
MDNFFDCAGACLAVGDPAEKIALTEPAPPIGAPGRPANLRLVAPRDLQKRRLGSREGHAALLHAIAHIEFNAINLAWDAAFRFREMPCAYYDDWIKVAAEEAYHFGLLQTRLKEAGYAYGDFPAHNGLWEAAEDTADDVLLRMALVPRVLEARGLDVTPGIMQRLGEQGDDKTVTILEIILRDEIGHVEIGSRWFHYLCDQRGLDREQTFRELMQAHLRGRITGPLHVAARLQAGFSAPELSFLESLIQAAG